MTIAEACLRLADELPVSLAESLIIQLRGNAAPVMPSPGYQARVDDFLRRWSEKRRDLAAMLEVSLAANRLAPTTELVWTGPATAAVPLRRTEQVLFDLIRHAEDRLTLTSFGVFHIPRLIDELESAIEKGVSVRLVLGDRETHSDQEIERQRLHLGSLVTKRALILQWPVARRPRDEQGRTGLMHVKAAVADSSIAFLTSANLTEAALERNMELGLLIRGGRVPGSIDSLMNSLIESGELGPL